MGHILVQAIEKALGWSDPSPLGTKFAVGCIEDIDLCERILTPHRLLDIVMRRSLEPPQFRCFQDGRELHPNEYLTTTISRRRQAVPTVNMSALAELAESGFTLVLDALDSFDPTIEVMCRALQWWSRELVQVNAYLTTQATVGFPLHWDDHDVIVVQLAGAKDWEVRTPSRAFPMYRDAEPNSLPSTGIIWSGTLTAGDVMHIPRGSWHQATRVNSGSGTSLHVTFGIVKRTGVDWLMWVADNARRNESFRRDLLRWATPSELAGQENELSEKAASLLLSLSPSEYLEHREQETLPAHHRKISNCVKDNDTVVCTTAFRPRIETTGDSAVVVGAGKRLMLKARALPVLRHLVSGSPARVKDVADETGINALRLAELLVKEDICTVLTPESLSGYTGLVTNGTF